MTQTEKKRLSNLNKARNKQISVTLLDILEYFSLLNKKENCDLIIAILFLYFGLFSLSAEYYTYESYFLLVQDFKHQ